MCFGADEHSEEDDARAAPLMCVMGRFDIHAFISHINAPMALHLTHGHSAACFAPPEWFVSYASDGSIVEADGAGDQGQHDADAQGATRWKRMAKQVVSMRCDAPHVSLPCICAPVVGRCLQRVIQRCSYETCFDGVM
jgi:hypothetical protein